MRSPAGPTVCLRVVKHIKSNWIVLAKDDRPLHGPGQVNRIWARERDKTVQV